MVAMAKPATPSSTTHQRVSPKTVEQAVNSLLKWRNSKSQNEKPKLFDENDEFLYLIVTLKKVPPKGRVNPHKVVLPHTLVSDMSELCLIIDDRPKSNLTKEAAQKKIKSENIPVSKVLKLSKLKTDYRPFEAKRKLCDSYNMFFADKRVVELLPKLLGKPFFKKKKIPVPLDLKHNNWKEQIEKVCSSALLFLRTGTCSVVRVAKLSMDRDEIVENVVAAINGIVEVVPKKWGNVRSFHLKLLESLALPVYQAMPDMKLKIEGVKDKEETVEEEGVKEISGDDEAKKDSKVGKKKGRIHEVRYMDSMDDDASVEDELGGDDDGDDGDVGESEDNEDIEIGGGKVVDKKRKKGNKLKEGAQGELNGMKRLMKSAKDKSKDVKQKKDGLSSKVKEGDVIKQKKEKLPVKDADPSVKKKKSGLVKSKVEAKVKVKRSKKSA
ncbi:Ribosomal protein [Quillaja saponaria]|uniref:Ribosomal protein n=1 Tax=Quillaja saponaria TaxID=32244 RepID=A0AAD7PRC0_QUISA|nr:Ribosomal protein [Quillaja saponaria]